MYVYGSSMPLLPLAARGAPLPSKAALSEFKRAGCVRDCRSCLAYTVGNAMVQAYQRSSMLERRRPVTWATFVTGAEPITASLFALMNTPSDTRRAISIRQPFAWAVIHAGKDCENRLSSTRRQFRPVVGARVLTLTSGVTGAAASCDSTTLGTRMAGISSKLAR